MSTLAQAPATSASAMSRLFSAGKEIGLRILGAVLEKLCHCNDDLGTLSSVCKCEVILCALLHESFACESSPSNPDIYPEL
eukprot:IDg2505t1